MSSTSLQWRSTALGLWYSNAHRGVSSLSFSPVMTPSASVYTEMNAISKGVSLGLYDEKKKDGVEASRGGSQPYVDLMGRRCVFTTRSRNNSSLTTTQILRRQFPLSPTAPPTLPSGIAYSL